MYKLNYTHVCAIITSPAGTYTARDPVRLQLRSLQILRAHLLMDTVFISFLVHSHSSPRIVSSVLGSWLIYSNAIRPGRGRRNDNIQNDGMELHKKSGKTLKYIVNKVTVLGIYHRILCQGKHHSGAYTQGLFRAQPTGLRGCLILR